MEMSVEKPKVMGISKQPSTVQIMIDEKLLENVDVCKCLDIAIKSMQDSLILLFVIRHVHSLFQSEFSTECDVLYVKLN